MRSGGGRAKPAPPRRCVLIQQLASPPVERSRMLLSGRSTALQEGIPQSWPPPRSKQRALQKCTMEHSRHAYAVPSPQKPQTPGRATLTSRVAWRGALGSWLRSMEAAEMHAQSDRNPTVAVGF